MSDSQFLIKVFKKIKLYRDVYLTFYKVRKTSAGGDLNIKPVMSIYILFVLYIIYITL